MHRRGPCGSVRRRKTTLDHKTTVDMNSFATVIFKPLRDGFKEHPATPPSPVAAAWQQIHPSAANTLLSQALFYCARALAAPCSNPRGGLTERHGRDRLRAASQGVSAHHGRDHLP